MRAALRIGLVLAVTRLAAVPAADAQQPGALPWKAGDAPPAVAGLRLGAPRSTIDSALGAPGAVRTLSPGVELLGYPTRGIALVYSEADSLAVAYLATPEAGSIGGTRVGDSRDSVVARWGEPTGEQDNLAVYEVGRWAIILRLDSARTRVELLGLARVAEPSGEVVEGPYDSTANARQDIEAALRESRSDHKLVLLDFGANWCLDCLVLDRLFGDSTVAGYLAANFRVVRVDVGRFDRNMEIARSYGDPTSGGVPAAVVLLPSGDTLATTKDGSLESARNMSAQQVLLVLRSWVAAARR